MIKNKSSYICFPAWLTDWKLPVILACLIASLLEYTVQHKQFSLLLVDIH